MFVTPAKEAIVMRKTVSVGVASCVPSGACRAESLVQAADANLYETKRQGRNRVVFSFPDD